MKCFTVENSAGFDFMGQPRRVSLNLPLWKNQLDPFTSLKEENHLEFMIKIYRDHGFSNMLGRTNAGAELIHDVDLNSQRCFLLQEGRNLFQFS
jgi:hypothetical protein